MLPTTGDAAKHTQVGERMFGSVSHQQALEIQERSQKCWNYLLSLLLLLLLLHALLDLAQEAGWMWGEALEAVLLCQLLQS